MKKNTGMITSTMIERNVIDDATNRIKAIKLSPILSIRAIAYAIKLIMAIGSNLNKVLSNSFNFKKILKILKENKS